MEISKSTPYVRYRENISSTLHKGTIHIESEYLDRERKTTIESIEGQTWQNMVNGENKEEEILPKLGLKIEGNEDVFDTVEQHMPIDTIIGDVEPVANENGTYTYEISTMEGSYAKTLEGENNFSLTSDGLVGDMYIKYNAQGEEVNGSIVMDNWQSSYTIENSNNGEIKSAILKGSTKYRDIETGEILEVFEDGRNLELVSVKMPVLTTTGKNLFDKTKIIFNKLIDLNTGIISDDSSTNITDFIKVIPNTQYTMSFNFTTNAWTRCFGLTEPKQGKYATDVNGKSDKCYFDSNSKTITFTTSPTTKYLIFSFGKGVEESFQIEQGSTATSYEPHKSNTLTTPEDVTLRAVGDVRDELDCVTGELTQRIGYYKFTGDENFSYANIYSDEIAFGVPTTDYMTNPYVPINNGDNDFALTTGFKFIGQSVHTSSTEESRNMCMSVHMSGKTYFRLRKDLLDTVDIDGFKKFIRNNPTEIAMKLSKESVKTVDLTITDQDDKIIQSLHTHPSTTHINLSSDGLIPSAEINYTMYGNIGETTGEQITDGTDSKLIEGKIYGDTLLNVLPSPSLKNSMENVSMQKLNNGYDNINVVDGEFKEATLYGQTLVNIFDNWANNDGTLTPVKTQDGYFLFTGSNRYAKVNLDDIPTFKRGVEYTFIYRIKNSTYDGKNDNSLRLDVGATTYVYAHDVTNGIWKIKKSFSTDETNCFVKILSWAGSTGSAEVSLQIIEGDYTNQDIPYFEGMQSVKMPVLTTSNEDGTKTNILSTSEDIVLRGIGNVKDELDLLTGELNQRIGEVVLDGSETVSQYSDELISVYKVLPTTNQNINSNAITSNGYTFAHNYNWGDDKSISYHSNVQCFYIRDYNETAETLKKKLSQNPITVQYELETPIATKTVIITVTNQDNQPQTALHSFANGYINVTSQGLLPKVDYEVATSNSYYLDMVKPNTQYTSKSSSDCNATIDGTTYPLSANGTFTTPSTITDNLMVLDAQVDDLMFIEGDLTGRELPYFEGLTSVENPLVVVGGKNLLDVDTILLDSSKWSSFSEAYANMNTPFMRLKPNTIYQMYGTITQKPNTYNLFKFHDKNGKEINGTYTPINNNNNNNSRDFTVSTRFTTPEDGAVYLVTYPAYNDLNNIKWLKEMFEKSSLMIEEGEKTSYEKPVHVHLTTQQPIALHRIGDIKDELDLVNECVVRRIGEIVLDGSENWRPTGITYGKEYAVNIGMSELIPNAITPTDSIIHLICDKLKHIGQSIHIVGKLTGYVCSYHSNGNFYIRMPASSVDEVKAWLANNKPTLYCKLATPTTEPVRIVPQNPKQSTTSLTLQSPLQKVGNVADQLRWNPYKGHYVRYNYIQDGVANSTYTFEDLKDMNERKFVNLYNQRTYIDTDHTVQVISHGLSRYCLAEQSKQYQVRWDWVEKPSIDTIKVDLCGNVKEIPSSDNSVVIDVEKFTHQFIQIQGLGLTGKITNLMVIETIDGEIPDVDFFSGIQCVGNSVNIDGNTKVQIDMEQTNGNLLDTTVGVYNNGNDIRFRLDMVRPNKTYTLKFGNSSATKTMKYNQKLFNDSGDYAIKASTNGCANIHYPFELCYADMAKDGIRPRYYDKESIILPMKLCRVGNIYDNLYYDDLKGYYRIQQSIGHKYFTGETTEVWTMETTNGYRTIKFTCTSANIDQIALGETICNSFRYLSTINEDMEGFIIYNGNFVIRVDKDRLTDKTVDGFKALLASSPIHLFYQLKTPQMINLTEYPNRIEFNTYRDEIFTFFKGMNPTKFTLSVPMDKTYRYEIEEEGQGLANRVAVNNETISAENVVAVKEVRGQGIANIIEDVDNVVITPMPNHEGRTPSHTLNNTKPATIRVHGFEPSGDTAIGTYNVTDKAYQLKVMSSNGDSSLSDYYVLNVPYKLETYADGTKDMVYYDEAYKQWHFKGSSVKEYTAASDGMLNETVEVFRGLAPRSGMIVEFKLRFTSGTTTARFSYSTNGVTYNSLSLRGMSDGNYLYVAFFNTGGTKIDMARKTDPNAEYELLSFLPQVPECLMVNQIQNCEFCEVTLDKQYIYSEMNSPIELDTYDGTTKVFMDGNATDTNIIIRNDATTKIVNTYTDTEYTVYWKYVDGLGNLRITLGGTTVEVDGKQEYATLKTQSNAPQELLYVGGYNLSIKDLMVVKGAKINDLPYFEGSRQVGTLVLDEEGNKSYKITLVQGGSVLEQRDEDAIAFKDDNKHNVVVHKIVGVCPTKVD